jgi:uncharacterized membrane protein YfcA
MDWHTGVLLVCAGIVGGLMNALAGGATLITFPAMLAAGLTPVIANASNAVAIFPGHLIAAFADREKLPAFDRRLLYLTAAGICGGAMGAFVLLAIPERFFVLPVPALIAFATLLFAFAPRIQAWSSRRKPKPDIPSSTKGVAVLAAASVYGGFFGAGLGVILTAVLAITEPNDIRAIKVLKNLLATWVTFTAIVIFISKGMVQWHETLYMLCGAIAGGYAGGLLIRVLPANCVRYFVIVAGVLMSVVYAIKYWR